MKTNLMILEMVQADRRTRGPLQHFILYPLCEIKVVREDENIWKQSLFTLGIMSCQ